MSVVVLDYFCLISLTEIQFTKYFFQFKDSHSKEREKGMSHTCQYEEKLQFNNNTRFHQKSSSANTYFHFCISQGVSFFTLPKEA